MFSLDRFIFIILCLWAAQPGAIAQEDPRLQGEALRRGTNPVWADAQQEGVQYGAKPMGRDDLETRDKWADDAGTFWSWLFGNGNSNSSFGRSNTGTSGSWSPFWTEFWIGFFYLLYYGILSLLAIGLIGGFVRLLQSQDLIWGWRRSRKFDQTEDLQAQQAKYSDLPVELERGLLGLKAQASALKDQGDYSKAIVYLFSYLLVELDSAHCILLSKGKTNYRYLRELARHRSLEMRLERVVMLFEECYFGRRTITKQQFDPIWEDLPDFEAEIKKASNLAHEPSTSGETQLAGASS